jgi:hypothetical protein
LEVDGRLQVGFGVNKGLPPAFGRGEDLGLRGMGNGEVRHGTAIIGGNPEGFKRYP